MKELDHKKIALLAAKRAIGEIRICRSLSDEDMKIIWQELHKIGESITDIDIKNEDNWLPFGNYVIGTKWG